MSTAPGLEGRLDIGTSEPSHSSSNGPAYPGDIRGLRSRGEHTISTTFEGLREVSPFLASRSGLSTAEQPFADVAAKIAEWSMSRTRWG